MENQEALETKKMAHPKTVFKGLALLVAISVIVAIYHLNSRVLFEGYEYGKLEEYTLSIVALPQTKETRAFLFYIQDSISDGKLTKWEKMRIQSKYENLTIPD